MTCNLEGSASILLELGALSMRALEKKIKDGTCIPVRVKQAESTYWERRTCMELNSCTFKRSDRAKGHSTVQGNKWDLAALIRRAYALALLCCSGILRRAGPLQEAILQELLCRVNAIWCCRLSTALCVETRDIAKDCVSHAM